MIAQEILRVVIFIVSILNISGGVMLIRRAMKALRAVDAEYRCAALAIFLLGIALKVSGLCGVLYSINPQCVLPVLLEKLAFLGVNFYWVYEVMQNGNRG